MTKIHPSTALRRLVLVRHGETAGQSSIRYFGATDVPLSDEGRRQMERVGVALAAERFDVVYTSGLTRTIEAARIIAPHLPAQPIAGFNEINFGQWEGLTRDEIAARDPQRFAQWRSQLDSFTYPEGDDVTGFRRRVAATFRALLPKMPVAVLAVVHRGVVASVVTELLHLSLPQRAAWPIDLASIHVLVTADGAWHAALVNDLRHLDGLP